MRRFCRLWGGGRGNELPTPMGLYHMGRSSHSSVYVPNHDNNFTAQEKELCREEGGGGKVAWQRWQARGMKKKKCGSLLLIIINYYYTTNNNYQSLFYYMLLSRVLL